uniref:hypothetical protein n=1 Tax=Sphingomonas hankookensis TaxID=563996 RepID=UPI001F55FF30
VAAAADAVPGVAVDDWRVRIFDGRKSSKAIEDTLWVAGRGSGPAPQNSRQRVFKTRCNR